MKILILLVLVAQTLSFPSEENVPESGRGVIDMLLGNALGTASRICLCRCGFPNREMRSVEENTTIAVESNTTDKIKPDPTTEANTPKTTPAEGTHSDVPAGGDSDLEKGQLKLVGGDVPPTHEFPWLVLVIHKGETVAGGALITDRHIITAASPLATAVAYDVKARIAVHDQCVGEITSSNVSVKAIAIHPAFSPKSRAHDLALLELSSLQRFDKRLHPICLPNNGPTYGEIATVISWLSAEGKEKSYSCEPRRVRQPILPEDDCSRAVTSPHLLTPDKSCIGVFGSKAVLCSGDVGSPVQTMLSNGRYELMGIMTDVNVCESTTNATLFIRVYDHINWIRDIITSDCTCRL